MPGNDFSAGMALIEKAINLNSNSASAFRQAGMLHAFAGDTKAALDHLARADRLNPLEGGVPIIWAMPSRISRLVNMNQ